MQNHAPKLLLWKRKHYFRWVEEQLNFPAFSGVQTCEFSTSQGHGKKKFKRGIGVRKAKPTQGASATSRHCSEMFLYFLRLLAARQVARNFESWWGTWAHLCQKSLPSSRAVSCDQILQRHIGSHSIVGHQQILPRLPTHCFGIVRRMSAPNRGLLGLGFHVSL